MSREAFIEARSLSKWYGQVVGLNDVSVTLGPGVTGLLGPNGAGKSTFLRLVSGQLRPSKGTLTVLGEPVFGNFRLQARLGLCPDIDAFYEEMSGARFLQAMLRLSGFSRADARVRTAETLEMVGLSSAAGKKIGAYSKGMRQRLKLGQAIAHRPQALFLDEPLNGLDPVGRAHLVQLIRDYGSDGRSVLVSSHILHEVEAMTEQIVLIHQGKILAEGRVREIRDLLDHHPRHVHVVCSDARRLASRLVAFPDVVRIAFGPDEGGLLVETRTPDDFYSRLPGVLRSDGISLTRLESPDEGLQAVFSYLVGGS